MPKKEVKSRGWCFTVNNYTDDDLINVSALYECDTNCKYLVIGFEVCPRTKTPHLQCYIYYTHPLRWNEFKSKLGQIHFEKQNTKKNVEAYHYCMEDDDFMEYGQRPRQGHRTDLDIIRIDLKHGKPMKDVANEYFSQWCFHRRSFEEFIKMNRIKFDTEIVGYSCTSESIKAIYEMKTPNSIVYTAADKFFNPGDILHDKYKGDYDYIFYPLCDGIEFDHII